MRFLAAALLLLLFAAPAQAAKEYPPVTTDNAMDRVEDVLEDYLDKYKEVALKQLDSRIADLKKKRECIAGAADPFALRNCTDQMKHDKVGKSIKREVLESIPRQSMPPKPGMTKAPRRWSPPPGADKGETGGDETKAPAPQDGAQDDVQDDKAAE